MGTLLTNHRTCFLFWTIWDCNSSIQNHNASIDECVDSALLGSPPWQLQQMSPIKKTLTMSTCNRFFFELKLQPSFALSPLKTADSGAFFRSPVPTYFIDSRTDTLLSLEFEGFLLTSEDVKDSYFFLLAHKSPFAVDSSLSKSFDFCSHTQTNDSCSFRSWTTFSFDGAPTFSKNNK